MPAVTRYLSGLQHAYRACLAVGDGAHRHSGKSKYRMASASLRSNGERPPPYSILGLSRSSCLLLTWNVQGKAPGMTRLDLCIHNYAFAGRRRTGYGEGGGRDGTMERTNPLIVWCASRVFIDYDAVSIPLTKSRASKNVQECVYTISDVVDLTGCV